MVYTQERLSRVQDLFRLPVRPQRQHDLRNNFAKRVLRDEVSKAKLRLGIAPQTTNTSSWLDKDDSGDYNPSSKKASYQNRTLVKRKRATQCDDEEVQGRKTKQPKRTWINGRQKGDKLEITLALKFERGLKLLRDIETKENDAPEMPEPAEEGPSLWRLSGGSFSSKSTSFSSPLSSYYLRNSAFIPNCIGNGLEHGFENPDDALKRNRKSKGNVGDTVPRRQRSPSIEFSYERKISNTLRVTTSWAHPIDFRHIDTADNPCDFCKDYRYGLLGLGRIEVEVRQFPGEAEYHEISRGHAHQTGRSTKMCRSCSYERLQIMQCPGHKVDRIADLDEANFDYARVKEHLFDHKEGSEEAISLWCSICISPAFYACWTAQLTDMYGQSIAPGSEESHGCGLLLCGDCAVAMAERGGDLQAVVRSLDQQSRDMREDLEFLLLDGMLAQTFAHGE